MRIRFLTSCLLVILLSGCSSSSIGEGASKSSTGESKEASPSETLSFKESCREAVRLIGRTTDLTLSWGAPESNESLAALAGVALSFGELAEKTEDPEFKTSILSLQESLEKMSVEETYFEGSSVYLAELTPLLIKCS